MTLTEFLLARIAEREAVARHDLAEAAVYEGLAPGVTQGGKRVRRALAECEAKRRIVERASVECICTDHGHNRVDGCPQCVACHAVTMSDGYVLADLALPDADHPDYNEAWRP